MSMRRIAAAIGTALALFAAVYVPTFAFASAVRPSMRVAIPLVIATSLFLSLLIIAVLIRGRKAELPAYGFRLPTARAAILSLSLGIPLSAAAWLALHVHPEQSPLANVQFSFAQAFFYFAVGAAIQEEVIFRGLIQSTLLRSLAAGGSAGAGAVRLAIATSALLFGAIHLTVGPVTALFAVVLGVLAGYWRHKTRSLLPAILCHCAFNMPGVLETLSR